MHPSQNGMAGLYRYVLSITPVKMKRIAHTMTKVLTNLLWGS